VVALRESRGAAVATSIASVALLDFFFVPPQGAFTVDDIQYLLTFAIMLAVAIIISGLTRSVREQARAQATLELEAETERIRSALLASISHDLRTPLAVMTGASSSLAQRGERLDESERRELARSVYEQAREMGDRVAKVLQMTRLETGAMALSLDWVSLPELAATVLDRLAERLAGHRVMVEWPSDLPLVHVDAVLVEQVLMNLLDNAARHTAPGTVVRLRAQLRQSDIVISVEDFGNGIPEGDVERVFAKFHHGVAAGTPGGMGLGLAIARAIVRLHRGEAWAERMPGGGTAFRFTILRETVPVAPAEPVEA
jgi:two-component system sensor histidine kinase KdpD